ncbi:FecR domain-containing protein [Maridesulfovibrio zosterae]|uniref:FecR domain-containing protein n=1 Tax=Maridesulfovibrio zosterae TaxID=82171 RepID=UPI0003F8CA48|nr:FecR domain-containing protein [Maridesulfovibrio zosterae]
MSPVASNLNSIGVVLASNGEVFLQSDSGVRQADSGTLVFKGEELVTGPASNAEVRFVDDTLLSQGADSSISLDDYVFDTVGESNSELLFKMSQGTFRLVTGKIAEQNPDRFQIGSPLATIGIRGTTTVHEISPDGQEKHGVEEIHSGKALLVQSIDGEVRLIDSPQALVDIASSGQISTVRPMTVQEFESFRDIAPSAIQQEQDIQEQNREEEEDEQSTGDDPNEEQPNDENADGDEQQADGGETGSQQIAGEGVLEPGVAAFIQGNIVGEDGIQGAINDIVKGVAEQVFEALGEGDIESAQALLDKFDEIPTSDEILELIEGIAAGTESVPEGLENVTFTNDEGVSFILGGSAGESWEGTPDADFYNGQGGNDLISGVDGNDSLKGGDGDDTISGGMGEDYILGDAGNDIINGDCGSDFMDGGEGTDWISFMGVHSGVTVSLASTVAVTEGLDSVTYIDTYRNFENLEGSSYDDTLEGDSGNNTLYGRGGDDTLIGGGGNDTVSYEHDTAAVSVTLTSGGGTATSSESGNDTLVNIMNVIGSEAGDTIIGNSSGNYLFGNDGADTLSGQNGNDTLQGGGGADTLTGGNGADIFYYHERGAGGDTITDFINEAGDKFLFNSDNFEALSRDGGTATFESFAMAEDSNHSGPVYIYDGETNELYYDHDGSGGDAAELIATTNGGPVSEADLDFT